MDWNSDGKKDLIVGDTDGYIHICLNQGTDAQPVLSAPVRLKVGGKVFQCPGGRAKPWVVDWNNDGKKDVLCGTENGQVLLLLNTGTTNNPVFKEASPLKDRGKQLQGGMRVCPAVWDWNGDGKKDLLCADEFGAVRVFLNQGTDASPVFASSLRLQAKGPPIHVRTTTQPSVSDLKQAPLKGFSPICGGYRSAITLADWNQDGKIDLVYGVTSETSNTGSIFVFLAE